MVFKVLYDIFVTFLIFLASKNPQQARTYWGFVGRGDRTRTCDILLPKQARYQLRYTSMNGAVVREIPHWDRPFSARIL